MDGQEDPQVFSHIAATLDDLRAVVGEPGEIARRKQIDRLDEYCRAFIARAPFVLMGTAGRDGACDVSPKGDRPGFVQVIDDSHLAIPERPGNRRLDSVRNLYENAHIGLLFLVPGYDESLRVNGRACITRDPALLAGMSVDGKAPVFAFGVEVVEVFVHCAKAARRAGMWNAERWPDVAGLPSAAAALHAHARPADKTVADVDRALVDSYARTLY